MPKRKEDVFAALGSAFTAALKDTAIRAARAAADVALEEVQSRIDAASSEVGRVRRRTRGAEPSGAPSKREEPASSEGRPRRRRRKIRRA